MDKRKKKTAVAKTNTNMRKRTIGALFRRATSKSGKDQLVPFVRLSGVWLNKYGFETGRTFEVRARTKRLVLVLKAITEEKNDNDVYMVKDSSTV